MHHFVMTHSKERVALAVAGTDCDCFQYHQEFWPENFPSQNPAADLPSLASSVARDHALELQKGRPDAKKHDASFRTLLAGVEGPYFR